MIKELESWIKNNKLSPEIIGLFEESIMCYKVAAYKSAYLMAYIGMQSVLRDRLLDSDLKPSNISDDMWNVIKSKLADDDEWDKEVSECVKRNKPDRIFLFQML